MVIASRLCFINDSNNSLVALNSDSTFFLSVISTVEPTTSITCPFRLIGLSAIRIIVLSFGQGNSNIISLLTPEDSTSSIVELNVEEQ